jgi:prephenate dehydratase
MAVKTVFRLSRPVGARNTICGARLRHQDNADNATSFGVPQSTPPRNDRTSLMTAGDKAGALYNALGFRRYASTMTKIESRPANEKRGSIFH